MAVNLEDLYSNITKRTEFWDYADRLFHKHPIILDRAKGARHPRYPDLICPLAYGYLEGTSSTDGDEIAVWIGSGGVQKPKAILLTIDYENKSLENVFIVGCREEEVKFLMDLVNSQSIRAMLFKRDGDEREMLRQRRSIRRFTDQPIPKEIIHQILEAATWAPSSHNRQPWRIAVLTSPEAKNQLAVAMGQEYQRDLIMDGLDSGDIQTQVNRSYNRITEAPVCLVLCLDPSLGDNYPDQKRSQAEYLMGVQSVAMAGQNLMLAATGLGVGSVWMCAPLFAPIATREALNLPPKWLPQGMVLLGFPAKEPVSRPRLSVDEIARFL